MLSLLRLLSPESEASFNTALNLAWGDVAVDNHQAPRMVRVHLKKSKCDQFGVGSDIFLGRSGSDLCPVAAVVEYVHIRGPAPGPFFLTSDRKTVTKHWFVGKVREILMAIGLPQQQYAGHSFRIGAATTAALAGVEDSMIQTLGRWQSSAFLQYIRTPKEQLAAVSAVLAHGAGASMPPNTPPTTHAP